MEEERSGGLIAGVLLALGLGVLLAATLPLAGTDGDDDDDVPTYFEAVRAFTVFEDDWWWPADLARVGVVAAAVSAVAFPRSERRLQATCISPGALATLGLPIWLYSELPEGESLGLGVIGLSIAFAAAAVIPWIAIAVDDRGSF